MLIFQVLLDIVAPIFILIGVGFVLSRAIDLDIKTLTRLSFYVLGPGVIFDIILKTSLSTSELLTYGGVYLLYAVVLGAISFAIIYGLVRRGNRRIMTLGTVFTNNGNYGIPLMLLVYGELGVAVNTANLLVGAIVLFTVAVIVLSAQPNLKETVLSVLKVPIIHAVWVALLFRALGWVMPPAVDFMTSSFSVAFIPIALITLGAQLASVKLNDGFAKPLLVAGLRLLGGPAVMAVLAFLLIPAPSIRPILIVSTAVPTAVNTYILAVEYDADPEFASQLVFVSTVLSAITVPVVVALVTLIA